MPHNPAKQSGTSTRTRWGYLGAFAFVFALAVTGCASTVTPSPVAADTPVAASSDASQPATVDLSSPSDAASATSAPATSAPSKPKVVLTTHAAVMPKPKPSLCGAPANPFGYNFCGRGGYIYHALPAKVCGYFNCIKYFGQSTGYMIECKDHTYSTAGGKSGRCSDHGGQGRILYSG